MSEPTLRYRPEIDGLRMIAVLAVVLYHFGFSALGGGFAGVDVFFVISGYLIGGILWREVLETGTVSLARFYTRRIRRLAPAFFAMALAATAVSWFVLLPFEFREFGKSLIAATVYLSNVLFFRGEGYFDIGADSKVLLHTWSLSVEEQFYIVLPLLILLLARWRLLFLGALWLAFAASLISSVWLTPTSQTATFYLFPFRAWELLTGVLFAIHTTGKPKPLGAWASWLGLTLVLAGLVFIQDAGFPGWQVIAPVLGTALMLASGQSDSPVKSALSSAPAVFIGKISYSLYLWHWPVYVLSHYWRGGYAGWAEATAWMALSFLLATLSWRYVETPFRRGTPVSLPRVLAALALPSALALGVGALAFVKDGLPTRFAPVVRAHIDASGDFLQDWSRCTRPASGPFAGVEICPIGPEGAPKVLIWGDSHVRAIKTGIELAAYEAETPALVIWHAGCPPLFGVSKVESYATPAQDAACRDERAQITKGIATLDSLKRVLLVGRWAYYAEGRGTGLDADNTIQISGHKSTSAPEVLARGLKDTAAFFSALDIALFTLQQLPEIAEYDSREAARALAHGHKSAKDIARAASLPLAQVTARQASAMEALKATPMIKTWNAVCDDKTCTALHDGQSFYFDNNHITNSASLAIRARFAPLFEGLAQ